MFIAPPLCFQFVSTAAAAPAAATTFASHIKTVWANLRYLAQRIYGSGEMYSMTFSWSWPKATAVASNSKKLLVCAIMWDTFIGSLQNIAAWLPQSYVLPVKILKKFCQKLLFWLIFFKKFRCVFSMSNIIWPYLRNGLSDCETKRKCIGLILGTICTWPLTSLVRNCWSHCCEMKMNWVNMILGRLYEHALWPHPWPWPWSWNFKVKVWNRLSGMGWPIDMERKRMCVIHSWSWYYKVWPWWGGQVYLIVTGVTSDVGVPLTYLVYCMDIQTIWCYHWNDS